MPFEIIWSRRALKHLRNIERPTAKRIYESVSALKEDPFKFDVIKLTNSPLYRFRVGDYRVIMDIKKQQLMILVVTVGHRKKIYE